jgi:glutamate dehydrogenase (NAD(P)+)
VRDEELAEDFHDPAAGGFLASDGPADADRLAGDDAAGKGGVERLNNEELLELECDLLVPAALGKVLHAGNADKVRAPLVLEAANYPLTPEADKILGERGIAVIPDILANAGGVIGSYFEWSQNIQQHAWTEDQFNQEMADHLRRAFELTQEFAESHGSTLRQAAFAVAIQRVAMASRLRGYV